METIVPNILRYKRFLTWAERHGLEIIDGVKPAPIPNRGIGVITERSIKVSDRAVQLVID